tara:strand:+ start:132 stop:425 length:294 start_codon:yes stop_codon:yes gene_type:complete
VDLDDVPERISSLMKEVSIKLIAQGGALERSATSLTEKGNIKEVVDRIEEARLQLMGVDLRLEDCQELLTSYQGAQVELARGQQQETEGVQGVVEEE